MLMTPAPDKYELADENELGDTCETVVYPISGTLLQEAKPDVYGSPVSVLEPGEHASLQLQKLFSRLHEDVRRAFPRFVVKGLTPNVEEKRTGDAKDSSNIKWNDILLVTNDILAVVNCGARKILLLSGSDLKEAQLDALSCALSRRMMEQVNLTVVVSKDELNSRDAAMNAENGFMTLNMPELTGHVAGVTGSAVHLGRGLFKRENPHKYPLYHHAYPPLAWVDGIGTDGPPVSFRDNDLTFNPDIDHDVMYPYGRDGEPFFSRGPIEQILLSEMSDYERIPKLLQIESAELMKEVFTLKNRLAAQDANVSVDDLPSVGRLLDSINPTLQGLHLIAPAQGHVRTDDESLTLLSSALDSNVPVAISGIGFVTWDQRSKVNVEYSVDANVLESFSIVDMKGFTPSEVRMYMAHAAGRATQKGLKGPKFKEYVTKKLTEFRDIFGIRRNGDSGN